MDKLLTIDQMAEILGVQKSTLYQWTHTGFIPHIKLGKLVRLQEKDVADWVERRNVRGRLERRIEFNL